MGCGASNAKSGLVTGNSVAPLDPNQNYDKQNGHTANGSAKTNGTLPSRKGGQWPTELPPQQSQSAPPRQVTTTQDRTKSKKVKNKENEPPAPKAVAFEVNFNSNIDSIISKNPPKRLSKLEPLDVPRLTAEQLEEKLRIAEEKRQMKLRETQEKGRRTSRLRQNILQAKQYEEENQQSQQAHEIEEKQYSASKKREQKRLEMEEKKKQREERARQIRERAKRIREGGEDLENLEMEKDETFNAEEDETWSDTETTSMNPSYGGDQTSTGDRAYSGRESHKNQSRNSADLGRHQNGRHHDDNQGRRAKGDVAQDLDDGFFD